MSAQSAALTSQTASAIASPGTSTPGQTHAPESRLERVEFHPPGMMTYREQFSPQDAPTSWQLDTEFDYSAVSLVRLTHVKVWTDYQVICVYDDEHGMYEEYSLFDESFDFACVSDTPMKTVEGTVALLPHLDPYNYYHWLIDTLPCFGVLELAGVEKQNIDHLYIHRMHSRFQRRHLKQLGFDPDTVLSRDHSVQHFSVDELIIPYFRLDQGGWPNAWAVDYLRRAWSPTTQLVSRPADESRSAGKRIYVARGQARRTVANEQALMKCLSDAGYIMVEPHKLTIEEQAAHFASADHVLASHGAGLANLVFCRPGTQVIEFGGHYITGHFRVVAELSSLRYRCIAGGSDEQGDRLATSYDGEYRDADFLADIDHIMADAERYFTSG